VHAGGHPIRGWEARKDQQPITPHSSTTHTHLGSQSLAVALGDLLSRDLFAAGCAKGGKLGLAVAGAPTRITASGFGWCSASF
jgi:hypothetical protein